MVDVAKTAPGTEHKNVIVLRVRMEFFQTSDLMVDKVLLGTLELESDELVAFEDGGPVPCEVKWTAGRVDLLGTTMVSCAKSLRVKAFQRSLEPGYTVRNRGGRRYEAHHSPAYDRGGYGFAASDVPDGDLVGNGGARKADQLLRVEVQLNAGKTYPLLLRYPPDPRQDWMYEVHEFRLWLRLIVGGASWDVEGPKVAHPAYEFTTDGAHSVPELKKALTHEYGNPGVAPLRPVGAHDYLDCLNAATRIGQEVRRHCAAATAFVNGKIPLGSGFSVTSVEVANTLLTEGGVLPIRDALRDGIGPDVIKFGGYAHLGIDSYATRWKADEGHLRAYTHELLKPYLVDPSGHNLESRWDELNTRYTTFKTLHLEEAALAVAALYAFFKERFALAVSDASVMGPWATKAQDLPAHVQHYWSTFFFNTSSGMDRSTPRIHDRGLEQHDLPWMQDDDYEMYQKHGEFNAAWRTATFRYLFTHAGL